MVKSLKIKPVNAVLIIILIILVGVTAVFGISSYKKSERERLEAEVGDLTIYALEQRILDYEISSDPNPDEATDIENDFSSYLEKIQSSSPETASYGRVILADFYRHQKRYADAIDILESDLQYEVPKERRYVTYTRLIDIFEHIHQPHQEKIYLELLLAMEDVHPQFESWEMIRETYQAKYDNLELTNE